MASKKPPTDKKSVVPHHPALAHLAQHATVVDPIKGKVDRNRMASEPYLCHVYRLEPREYSGGPEWLKAFNEAPPYELIKRMFGGGTYQLKIFQNGAYQKGGLSLTIAGAPKILKDEDAPATVAETAASQGDGKSGDLAAMFAALAEVERKVESAIDRLGDAKGGGLGGLTPERIREIMGAVNATQIESRLINSLFPAAAPVQPTPAAPAVDAQAQVTMVMDIFRMGMEFGQGQEGKGESDITAMLVSQATDLLKSFSGKRPAAPAAPAALPAAAPVASTPALTPAADPPDVTEAQREQVEAVSEDERRALLVQRLKAAICTMLDAITSEIDYTVDDVCGFVLQVITPQEIGLVGDRLTFDNVRALMEGEPENQITLDEKRAIVESVLAKLKGVQDGAGES